MEGATALVFMGSDGSGPYAVTGPPGNGALPVAAFLSPLSLQNVNITEVLTQPALGGGLAGLLAIGGPGAAGAPLDASFPLKIAGSDGVDLRTLSTDAGGRLVMVGAAAAGALTVGAPVLIGGSDGVDARTLSTDTSGRQIMVGAAAAGAPTVGAPVLIGGSDGVDARTLSTDAGGRQIMVGAAAAGAPTVGAPVLIGGSDGVDARALATDASGRVVMVGAAAAGAALAGAPVLIGGSDGVDVQPLRTTKSGVIFADPNGYADTYSSACILQALTGQGVIWSFQGSATKIIRIKRVTLTVFSAAAQECSFYVGRLTVPVSTGVPIAASAFPLDIASPASTVTANQFYSTAGNITTVSANVGVSSIQANVIGQVVALDHYVWQPAPGTKELIISGAGQSFYASLGIGGTGNTYTMEVNWTEE